MEDVTPIFKIALKNYCTSIPSDKGQGTYNPRSLGIKAIFAIFRILSFFFKITSAENFIFFMMKLKILHEFPYTICCGLMDNI